jgi:hypothetical protein
MFEGLPNARRRHKLERPGVPRENYHDAGGAGRHEKVLRELRAGWILVVFMVLIFGRACSPQGCAATLFLPRSPSPTWIELVFVFAKAGFALAC